MKRVSLLTRLFPVIFIGIPLYAQTGSKVDLGFVEKIPAWMAENDVPAVGTGHQIEPQV